MHNSQQFNLTKEELELERQEKNLISEKLDNAEAFIQELLAN